MVPLISPSIRIASPADASAIADIYRPAVTDSAISFELEPPDASTMAERLQATLVLTPWVVADSGETLLGYAYAGRHRERAAYRWSTEVSVYVHRDWRRAGVARALYTSLIAVLSLQGYRNAYAGITLPNEASIAMHQAFGFTPVGLYKSVGYKCGKWHDVAWLELTIGPYTADPTTPTPLPELAGSSDLARALAAGLPLLRIST